MYPDRDDSGPALERSTEAGDWAWETADKEMKRKAANAVKDLEMPRRLFRSMR
jgi:hypothetical protein